MAIVFDKDHVDQIGVSLTKALGKAMQDGVMTLKELSEISQYILSHIDEPKSHLEMIGFLEVLVKRWTLFKDILTIEKGEELQEEEKTTITQVQKLIKQNQLDKALQTVQA